jgi:hypothetical protein
VANLITMAEETAVLLISADAAIDLSMLAYIVGSDPIKMDVYLLLGMLCPSHPAAHVN